MMFHSLCVIFRPARRKMTHNKHKAPWQPIDGWAIVTLLTKIFCPADRHSASKLICGSKSVEESKGTNQNRISNAPLTCARNSFVANIFFLFQKVILGLIQLDVTSPI